MVLLTSRLCGRLFSLEWKLFQGPVTSPKSTGFSYRQVHSSSFLVNNNSRGFFFVSSFLLDWIRSILSVTVVKFLSYLLI